MSLKSGAPTSPPQERSGNSQPTLGCFCGVVSMWNMPLLAVTVVGHDRPGIVAEVTEAVSEVGGNLEDSSMTLLRGHFAMTLIADVPAGPEPLRVRLVDLAREDLSVSILALPQEPTGESGLLARLSVHGADRPGIVSTATATVARYGGNIVDLATRLGSEMYVLIAEVIFPANTDLVKINDELATVMNPLGVQASLQPDDEDLF